MDPKTVKEYKDALSRIEKTTGRISIVTQSSTYDFTMMTPELAMAFVEYGISYIKGHGQFNCERHKPKKDDHSDYKAMLDEVIPPSWFHSLREPLWGFLQYRMREHKFKYKNVETMRIWMIKLYQDTDGKPHVAYEAIMTAIANGWKGIFPKRKTKGTADRATDIENTINALRKQGLSDQEIKDYINHKFGIGGNS